MITYFSGWIVQNPLQGSLRKVQEIINRRVKHAIHFSNKMIVKILFLAFNLLFSNINLRIL
jgi:hypothetical protein